MTDPNQAPTGAVNKRRRWPWIVLGLFVLLAVLVLLAPTIGSGLAAGVVSKSFAEDHRGRLEIGKLDLAWFSAQKVEDVRLLDPSGAEVARVSIDLPSLAHLAGSGGKKIGKVLVVASANVVSDDAGSTNLQRALEETEAAKAKSKEPKKDGEPLDLGKLLRELDLDLEVRVTKLTWSDVRTRALGKPFELADFVTNVAAKPGQPLALTANGVLASEGSVPVQASAKVTDLFAGSELNPAARFELDADIASLPSGLVDALSGQDGLVASVLGERFRLQARGAGTLTQGDVSVDVTGDKGRAQIACAVRDQVLRTAGESGITLVSELDTPRLQRWLSAKLPATMRVEVGQRLNARVAELEVPLATPIELDTLLAGLHVRGEATLDGLTCTLIDEAKQEKRVELADAKVAFQIGQNGDHTPVLVTTTASLRPSGQLKLEITHPDARTLAKFGPGQVLDQTRVQLVAQSLDLAWVEQFTGGAAGLSDKLGKKLDVDVQAIASLTKDQIATVEIKAKLNAERGATNVNATLALSRALEIGQQLDAGALPAARLSFSVEDQGLVQAFVPASVAEDVRELVGAKFGGSVESEASEGKDARISCMVKAERVELNAKARVADRVLTLQGDDRLQVIVRPSAALLARHVSASLPQGAKLAFVDAEPRVELALSDTKLPLDAWMPAEGKAPAELADVVRRTAAQVKLTAPSVRYEQPPIAAGAKPVPIDVADLVVAASLTPAQPAAAHVTGQVAGAQGGRLMFDASCADPGAFLAENAALPPLELHGDIAGLPTALADALAGQNGLLVDTLGPTVDVKLAGKLPSAANEPLRANLKSQNTSVDLVANLAEKTVVATGQQGLNASVPLSPLFSQRIVGNLVPLLVNASKPQGAKPVGLSVSEFALPLDGDLRRLNATVKLDLGEVVYDLLPGLNSALASAGAPKLAQQKFTIQPLVIPIKDGVARYDKLPLSIGGEEVVFKGSFDLATREMALSTDLPLKALGSKVEKELDKVRQYLDPNMLVPIEIKGAWNKPKISLGKDFMEKVVKKAGEDALKKGLFDLIDNQLGKDKKKDGDG